MPSPKQNKTESTQIKPRGQRETQHSHQEVPQKLKTCLEQDQGVRKMLYNWCENLKTRFKVFLGPALMSEWLFASITVSEVETLEMTCHTTSFLSDPKTLNRALSI